MFTGWTGVALNPFNPNVLTARAELQFFLPLFSFLYEQFAE